jgi:DNA repair exonuclease SbcCD ATPase subunit
MEILALVISILSLIIGSIAYIRSGGKQDIRAVERALNERIEELRALVHRTGDSLVASVRAGYQRSVRAIDEMASLARALGEIAVEEVREDLRAISETLDRLSARAAREIKEVKAGITAAVVEAEEALRRAVEEARARLAVIEAKQQLALAFLDEARNNLVDAESHVEAAMFSLKTARSLTSEHVKSLEDVQKQALRTLVELRAKADTLKATLDSLIKRNNLLLAEMSGGARPSRMAA